MVVQVIRVGMEKGFVRGQLAEKGVGCQLVEEVVDKGEVVEEVVDRGEVVEEVVDRGEVVEEGVDGERWWKRAWTGRGGGRGRGWGEVVERSWTGRGGGRVRGRGRGCGGGQATTSGRGRGRSAGKSRGGKRAELSSLPWQPVDPGKNAILPHFLSVWTLGRHCRCHLVLSLLTTTVS